MRSDVYVAVEDMERVVDFYSRLFGEAPVMRTLNDAGLPSRLRAHVDAPIAQRARGTIAAAKWRR